jgi:hypothetical protein
MRPCQEISSGAVSDLCRAFGLGEMGLFPGFPGLGEGTDTEL